MVSIELIERHSGGWLLGENVAVDTKTQTAAV